MDQPTVGIEGAKQAAAMTLPAATLPAGREHLPVEGTLILLVLRHTKTQLHTCTEPQHT